MKLNRKPNFVICKSLNMLYIIIIKCDILGDVLLYLSRLLRDHTIDFQY